MNPRGEERMGRTDGNVMTQLPNGFTKGTSVHTQGPDINTTAELRWQKPYVARYNQFMALCVSLSITCKYSLQNRRTSVVLHVAPLLEEKVRPTFKLKIGLI